VRGREEDLRYRPEGWRVRSGRRKEEEGEREEKGEQQQLRKRERSAATEE
jgi:hypothetical protein